MLQPGLYIQHSEVFLCLNFPILWHKHFTDTGVTIVMNGHFQSPQLLVSTEHLSLSFLCVVLSKSLGYIVLSHTYPDYCSAEYSIGTLGHFPDVSVYSPLVFSICSVVSPESQLHLLNPGCPLDSACFPFLYGDLETLGQ